MVGCVAVFPAASSVGVARSPRVGVPSIPVWFRVAGGRVPVLSVRRPIRAPAACAGGMRPRGSCGVRFGWGGTGPSVVVCPSCVWVLVPAVVSSFSAPRSLFLPLPGAWVVSCSHVVSLPVPCAYGRLPVTLGPSVPPCRSVPFCPLPSPCPCPFPSRCGGGGVGGGCRWPRPGSGCAGAIGGGFGGCRGDGSPGLRPG